MEDDGFWAMGRGWEGASVNMVGGWEREKGMVGGGEDGRDEEGGDDNGTVVVASITGTITIVGVVDNLTCCC